MGLDRNLVVEEVKHIKGSLDFLSEHISTNRHWQENIVDIAKEVKLLYIQKVESKKKSVNLENQIAELEQYKRGNDFINGLQDKLWSAKSGCFPAVQSHEAGLSRHQSLPPSAQEKHQ